MTAVSKMRTTGLPLAAAATIIATTTTAASLPPAPPAVHEALVAAVAAKSVTGEILLVRRNDKLVFADAVGEADGLRLKTDSVFWIASMTKPIVASTVMMLVDEGKISLDDPISKYVPEFNAPRFVRTLRPGSPPIPPFRPGIPSDPNTPQPIYDLVPAARPLKVRDFMTMTAGLQTIFIPNRDVPPVLESDTVASYVAKLGTAPLDFQPGSRWAYSNATEFELLVRVVEVASGQPYAQFLQTRVLTPLGMIDTHFGVRESTHDRNVPAGRMVTTPLLSGHFTSGSAGLWSTAIDYSHFAEMLLDGGVYKGRRLLSKAAVTAMSTNEIGKLNLAGVDVTNYGGLGERKETGTKYGFGMLTITDPRAAGVRLPAGSYGWDGVGTRRFWVDPKDRLVIVIFAPGPETAVAQRQTEAAVLEAVVAR